MTDHLLTLTDYNAINDLGSGRLTSEGDDVSF